MKKARVRSRHALPLKRGDRVHRVNEPRTRGTVDEAGPEQTMVKWDWSESRTPWAASTRDLVKIGGK
jgi:hypothetical protein